MNKVVKITTNDGETRWLNLKMMTRATMAKEAETGRAIMVLMFADAESRLVIRAEDDVNQKAIDRILRALED